MRTAIVLFNRDLRVHDHAALTAAGAFERIIPLFVLDASITAPPNRLAFLVEALRDLDASLTRLGAPLVVRRGAPEQVVAELTRAHRVDATFASADYTAIAQRRERRLPIQTMPGVAIVAPGQVTPTGRDRFKVFTAYWNKWRAIAHCEPLLAAPLRLHGLSLRSEALPVAQPLAPDLAPGGESIGRAALTNLSIDGYARGGHDDLAADATSRLSPYLHFGCLSPRQVMARAQSLGADGDALIRQLCWRDFFLQYEAGQPVVLPASRPSQAFAAWADGRTGYLIVDAGMRQLLREGWMHNRARMITASFLVHDLGIDWRLGAAHFMRHLVDGDVANNNGNWRWVAGDGLNTRPGREMNPIRQAARFDPTGEYVRRYVTDLDAPTYPQPIIPADALVAVRNRRP